VADIGPLGRPLVAADSYPSTCCRSSVVEHSIGNGEVDSSILSGSTTKPLKLQHLRRRPLRIPPRSERERKSNTRVVLGENPGSLFACCSAADDAAGPFETRAFAEAVAGMTEAPHAS
jgi:hypothetical protein